MSITRLYEDAQGGLVFITGEGSVLKLPESGPAPGGLLQDLLHLDKRPTEPTEIEQGRALTLVAEAQYGTITVFTDRMGATARKYAGLAEGHEDT